MFACLQDWPSWEIDGGTTVLRGPDALVELAVERCVDLVIFASSGNAGFRPLLAALDAGKQVALANKEALVMAGELVSQTASRAGITIRPVDSEHSAIWQCLQGEDPANVAKLKLTASGGPFRSWSLEQLRAATAEDALRHPTWNMGAKITIDSATLMNKGLEVIEAHWLFDVPFDNIEVLVHPQSIVHSLVEFRDGSIKAQLGAADMRTPIQYALSWPERWEPAGQPSATLPVIGQLEFALPDEQRFPCLALARNAALAGGTYPTALCAADDVVVQAFLQGTAAWDDIAATVGTVLDRHKHVAHPSLDEILEADVCARRNATDYLAQVRKGA